MTQIPLVLITVDTEALWHRASGDHIQRLIYGRFEDEDLGIGKMCRLLQKAGGQATFFIDYAECNLYGDDFLDVARFLHDNGQDVQPHVHIENLPDFKNRKLDQLTQDECLRVVDYICGKHRKAGLPDPLVYRAGALRWNSPMLSALKERNFCISSNYAARFSGKDTALPIRREFQWSNGLFEVPISCAELDGRRVCFDYNSVDMQQFSAFEHVLKYNSELLKSLTVCLLMHSWSFLELRSGTSQFGPPSEDKSENFVTLLACAGKQATSMKALAHRLISGDVVFPDTVAVV